jgi:hypothetical protein
MQEGERKGEGNTVTRRWRNERNAKAGETTRRPFVSVLLTLSKNAR